MDGKDYKKGVKLALFNYYKNQTIEVKKKKNQKPETQALADIMMVLKIKHWLCFRYEAKSAFDPISNKYRMTHVVPGHTDIAGITPEGFPFYIEVKAKGKRSQVRDNQIKFILDTIRFGSFSIVADSGEYVLDCYTKWIDVIKKGSRGKEGIKYLIGLMPKLKRDFI